MSEADTRTQPTEDFSHNERSSEPASTDSKEEDTGMQPPAPGASFIELQQYWTRPDRFDEPGVLEPEHPLMERFQQTLRTFLERQNLRLTEELRDLEADLKQAKQARDDAGVRLYERQQEVSSQQRLLEKCHEDLDHLSARRQREEDEVEKSEKEHNEVRKMLAQQEEQESALQTSLQKLTDEEKQLSDWAAELDAELAISQRMASKDRQQTALLAEEKRRQDAFLYKLTAEVANLRDQMSDLAGKLRIKEQERKEAGQAAADAGADLEALQLEQKRLAGAWRGVVVLLQRRDKAYEAVLRERRELEERVQMLARDAEGYRAAAQKEMERGEESQAALGACEAERAAKERTRATLLQRRDDLRRRLADGAAMVRSTDAEIAAARAAAADLRKASAILQREVERVTARKRQLEQESLEGLGHQLRNDKLTTYLQRKAQHLRDKTREQALLLVQSEHQTAATDLEAARTRGALQRGNDLLQELRREDDAANRQVEATQAELEFITKTIAQRTATLVVLNSRLEVLVSRLGGKFNPLEAKLTGLTTDLRELEQEVQAAQAFWLRQQSNAVTLTQQRNEQITRLARLRKEVMVLDQKNVRLEREALRLGRSSGDVERTLKQLYGRLEVADKERAARRGRHEQAHSEASVAADTFAAQLHEAEEAASQLQAEVEALEEEREERAVVLLAAQQEQLAWEKKLRLVQRALVDIREERSSAGDTCAMRAEIHRMEVRRGQLQRAQDKLVSDLEQSVSRRSVILEQALARDSRPTRDRAPTLATVRQRVGELRARVECLRKEAAALDHVVTKTRCRRASLLAEARLRRDRTAEVRRETTRLEQTAALKRALRGRRLERLVRLQRRARWLGEARAGRYRPLQRQHAIPQLDAELRRQRSRADALAAVADALLLDFPLLLAPLHRLLGALQVA